MFQGQSPYDNSNQNNQGYPYLGNANEPNQMMGYPNYQQNPYSNATPHQLNEQVQFNKYNQDPNYGGFMNNQPYFGPFGGNNVANPMNMNYQQNFNFQPNPNIQPNSDNNQSNYSNFTYFDAGPPQFNGPINKIPRTITPPPRFDQVNEKRKPMIYAQPNINYQAIQPDNYSKNISPAYIEKDKNNHNIPRQEPPSHGFYNIKKPRDSLQKKEKYHNIEYPPNKIEIRKKETGLNNMKDYKYNYTDEKVIKNVPKFQDAGNTPIFQQPLMPFPIAPHNPVYQYNNQQNITPPPNIPPLKNYLTVDRPPEKHNYARNINKQTIIIPRKFMIGLQVGDSQDIKQEYTFMKKLGQGSFGTVYKVMHNKTKDYRAVKVLDKTMLKENPTLSIQIKSEFNILRELDNPNIIKIFGAYETSHQIFIITELLSGGTLLDKMGKNQLAIDELQILKWVTKILKALSYCHGKKVAHRDLKPENIMFDEKDKLKLIDFGLSGFIDAKRKFQEVVGSPIYMAPEVINNQKYSEQCDIWSLGIMIIHLYTGRFPYKATTIPKLKEEINQIHFTSAFFSNPIYGAMSPYAKEFLSTILRHDPLNRPSASKCLSLPYIHLKQPSTIDLDKGLKAQIFLNMKEYHEQSTILRLIRNFITANGVATIKSIDIAQIFESLDQDKDGKLSFEEMRNQYDSISELFGVNKEEFEKILEKMDIDKDGFIGYTEFCSAAVDNSLSTNEDSLDAAFDFIDKDKDGFITKKDLATLFRNDAGIIEHNLKSIMVGFEGIQNDKISKSDFIISIKKLSKLETKKMIIQRQEAMAQQ